MIQEIKEEMKYWFKIDLTDTQIKEYLKDHDIDCFDTLERSDFIHWLSNKIAKMDPPVNDDSEEYKYVFYKKMQENAKIMGYKLLY